MNFEAFYSSSAGNLYRLSADGCPSLLLECGVPIRQIRQALDFRLSEIEVCLITHSHMDHCKAAKELMAAGIVCCMTKETAEAIGAWGTRLRIVEPGKTFTLGKHMEWIMIPFISQHDCPGSVGYFIVCGEDRAVFLTDSFYCEPRFRNLTHVFVECNYSLETLSPDLNPAAKERLMRSHFSLENVKQFLCANDLTHVKEIHLLHLSQGNSDAEYFKSEIEKASGKPVYVAQEKP